MSNLHDVVVPDIGGAEGVEVIEILVSEGDSVEAEVSLITLESEKATMEIPSPQAGKVASLKVKVGDKVSEGDLIAQLETAAADATDVETPQATVADDSEAEKVEPTKEEVTEDTQASIVSSAEMDIALPDLGTDDEVEVIEINVSVGDTVHAEDSLITLESDKATMDVPAPADGTITALTVKTGDKVKTADVIGKMTSQSAEALVNEKPVATAVSDTAAKAEEKIASPSQQQESAAQNKETVEINHGDVHAGPGVRRLANDLGISLSQIKGSGRKGRILREDLTTFAKSQLSSGGGASVSGSGLNVAALPQVDFAKFGEIEVTPLSRIQKLSGKFLHRNWVSVPHVTQFDEADITDMEAFRQQSKKQVEAQGAKLTPLVFIMKAAVSALKAYPQFNASLDASGENLILKKYFHIGVAVDTPNGLVVPVIRDVDQKSFTELAIELGEVSKKARDGKLLPTDMQGGCFSISSLGGIGGTAFTPIVNMPEVSILGVSKSEMKPKFIDGEFKPRLMLPLCLSYDHRVIDGALAARFIVHLSASLNDLRRLLL